MLISQYVQHVEVITRPATGWQDSEYGYGDQFTLASVDIALRVADVYRRLSIPVGQRSLLPIEIVETRPEPEDEP